MYNDFPGCSESYDLDVSIDEAKLSAAIAKRDRIQFDIDALTAERDGYTVNGCFFPNIDDARMVRQALLERWQHSVARLNQTITALRAEIDITLAA